jgi:hypothetical protein
MRWVQTRYFENQYEKFFRFKCNRCGTTQEVPFGSSETLPKGWKPGLYEGWHFCPGCERPARTPLPVLP